MLQVCVCYKDIYWNINNISGAASLKKTDVYSSSSQQPQQLLSKKWSSWAPPLSLLEFWLVWYYAGVRTHNLWELTVHPAYHDYENTVHSILPQPLVLPTFCPLFHNNPWALGIYDIEVIDYPLLSNAHYTASTLITSAIIKFQIRYVLYLHPQVPVYPSSTSTHQHFLLEEDFQD